VQKVFIADLPSFLYRSYCKGKVIAPQAKQREAKLFLFDDLSWLGIKVPSSLLETLAEENKPMEIISIVELAETLKPLLLPSPIAVINGGGVLALAALKDQGYQFELKELATVTRTYLGGIPQCSVEQDITKDVPLVIDDIIASGKTLLGLRKSKNQTVAALLTSAFIPQGNGFARERQRSTVLGYDTLYTGTLVNGLQRSGGNQIPAILSLRYLLTKAIEDEDYNKHYLQKKLGGEAKARRVVDDIKTINTKSLAYLRKDPIRFLQMWR
jgi:hypothetical protein